MQFSHPRSSNNFFSKNNSKSEAIIQSKKQCLNFVRKKYVNKKNELYLESTKRDYQSCKLKATYQETIEFFVNRLYEGENIKTIKSKYNLSAKKIDKIKKIKYQLEQENLIKYINILHKGKTLDNQYLEKETLKDVKIAKLKYEEDNIDKYINILHKGKTLDNQYLEKETLKDVKIAKLKYEEDNIDKYLEANLKGSDLRESYLEKETIELVKVKRQERREILYAKTCTGWVFGHKKGTYEWFKCLDDEEQKELFEGTEIKIVKEDKVKPLKPEKIIKTTSTDNDAPVIEIAEAITVDSQAYTLKGKVKDKSQIYLTINGRQVEVKKGEFKVDRFNIDPDVVEELKIVAIDQWNNKSEKIVKVTIDLQSTELARSFEDLKPNNVKVKTDKNKIAIIIGIEKYVNLINLDAKYANRDAKAFRAYATRALGVKSSNIKILVDDKATRSQTLKAFKLWLPRIAGDGGKDILIFFAGHGLASDNGEDLYILPQDGESSLLEDTAISRVELISLVQKVNPKSVTMFFDTCYSGQTRDERMLVASLRPIRIVADEQDTPNNFTIFTASNYDQTSGSIEEAKHGMFSYYLMKGLEGKADNNKDKRITNGELIAYLKTNVSKEAFTQNREQDPMLSGDPDQVLMSYR